MTAAASASFLNLDLELDAASDLAPLAQHLKGRVFILFCGPTDSGFRLALEALTKGRLNSDPKACTDHLLDILETLPSALMQAWQSCTSRVFDYGFDGGLESPPIHMTLPSSTLARAARLGLDFRITVYPFREHSDE
ncbi:hypothetical protein [Piscinibacter terrae]|uniref:DUF4279 domain-containing protein n=1 Tax=Piscinibacter terrae TaxID=2496871 RepID=A0A3N7HJ21_9BURK|nr:hypothetical protein [Albitalea terrae]RQP21503.1 hypothetical protein DZC73_26660 [Albitalea terrae]